MTQATMSFDEFTSHVRKMLEVHNIIIAELIRDSANDRQKREIRDKLSKMIDASSHLETSVQVSSLLTACK
jgi:D-ribose pyranose/furanose isomerase RbsD